MNLSQTAVTNAVNLAFFMVNLSHHLLADFRLLNLDCGILDLGAFIVVFDMFVKVLYDILKPRLQQFAQFKNYYLDWQRSRAARSGKFEVIVDYNNSDTIRATFQNKNLLTDFLRKLEH